MNRGIRVYPAHQAIFDPMIFVARYVDIRRIRASFLTIEQCFDTLPERNHPHDEDDFEETCKEIDNVQQATTTLKDHHFIAFAILKEVEAEKAREEARAKELAAGKHEHTLLINGV